VPAVKPTDCPGQASDQRLERLRLFYSNTSVRFW
jgi:hypothetical protein